MAVITHLIGIAVGIIAVKFGIDRGWGLLYSFLFLLAVSIFYGVLAGTFLTHYGG